jgi:hypothetical protein
MFPAAATDKSLQWDLEFSPARKPGTMDSVACPVNIASPDPLKGKQNVATQLRSDLLQLIRKPHYSRRTQAFYRSKWPLVPAANQSLPQAGSHARLLRSHLQVVLSTLPRHRSANNRGEQKRSEFSLSSRAKSKDSVALSCTSHYGIPRLCSASLE